LRLAARACTLYGTLKAKRPVATPGKRELPQKRISAIFYRSEAGGEPVRDWLKSLRKEERKLIGQDIRTVEFGWPVGMPVSRPLGQGLHEVRTNLPGNRIARVLFYIDRLNRMVLLHGFIKKTRKTPADDLRLALGNKAKHHRELQ
jgi:phage-related protein